MITLTGMLAACSTGVNVGRLMVEMPQGERSVVVQVPATNNPLSDAVAVGMIKTSGSPSASNMIEMLGADNINVGVAGGSQMFNKATALYSLNHAKKVGNNVSVYMTGDSESDKADLENAANAKILNYIISLTKIICSVQLAAPNIQIEHTAAYRDLRRRLSR
ncbi:putative lipoprotein [Neisseria gonorrhoeae]|uniref:Putative lipoprotein n=1 Tax=Neisseria gonorrhoeae TaxID=485 RepID=A0A378VWC0_NEIGO|nr:putative lipoprotein [Neisseria gonorrhoeae]